MRRRERYLLGQPLHMFAPNRLPTMGEVCRRIYWLRSKNPCQLSANISCPQLRGSNSMKCIAGECEPGNKGEFTGVCILRELVNLWAKGGYTTDLCISEKSIK